MITSEQLRGARHMLKLTVEDLARESGLGVATLKRMEAGFGVPSANLRSIQALCETYLRMGLEFTGSPEAQPGIRLLHHRR